MFEELKGLFEGEERTCELSALLTACMQACVDEQEEYWGQFDTIKAQRVLSDVRVVVAGWVSELDFIEEIEREELEILFERLRAGGLLKKAHRLVILRGCAEGIEEAGREILPGHVCCEKTRVLKKGDLFVRPKSPLREVLGRGMTSPPDRQEPAHTGALDKPLDPAVVNTLRLMTDLCGFRVTIHNIGNHLMGLSNRVVIAGAIPHEDFKLDSNFQCKQDQQNKTFYAVRPKEPTEKVDAQIQKICSDRGAHIVVFPELSGTQAEVEERIRAHSDAWICCGGSYHVDTDDESQYANVALTKVRGIDEPYMHSKFNPFTHRALGTEQISTKRSLTLLVGHRWSVVTLICKDLILSDILRVLEQISPSLILVVALGDKTEEQEVRGQSLSINPQSIVVFVNCSSAGARCSSFFTALPLRAKEDGTKRNFRTFQRSEAKALVRFLTVSQGNIEEETVFVESM